MLTSDQLERMERNRQEALKRKARLISSSASPRRNFSSSDSGGAHSAVGGLVSHGSPSSSYTDSTMTTESQDSLGSSGSITPRLPPRNTYRTPVKFKRDERSEEESTVRSIRTIKDLPPLPPNCPSIRDETLTILSSQQLEVILAARPPTQLEHVNEGLSNRNHPIVRVNAAAGTGKTTALSHLTVRLIDLEHKVTYVTYGLAAATDAKTRMCSYLNNTGQQNKVSASTLHSCAMRLLQNELPCDEEVEDKRLLNDIQLKKFIAEKWNDAIEEYLRLAIDDARRKGRNVRLLYEKTVHYLFKTLENFTRKNTSLETLKDKMQRSRHYYPLTSEFRENGVAAKLGFPPHIYSLESSYSFFADTCVEIWDYIVMNGIRSYNIEMKKAQLQNLRIQCTVLLVDECQDLDECQVDWIEGQKKFGTHIFLVGDSVQCIYGFRGAKSTHVMKLNCTDVMLTKSYRFGPEIAMIANLALYAKEKSPQTLGRTAPPLWIRYRIEGVFAGAGLLTTKSPLLDRRKHKQITVIASTNGCLMKKALDLLGLANLKNPAACDNANDDINITEIPRIHINGKGETSGMKLWNRTVKIIRTLHELFTNVEVDEYGQAVTDEHGCPYYLSMHLPSNLFKDFVDVGPVTWDSFKESCFVREIGTYVFACSIVETYRENTLLAMDEFESRVLTNKCSEDDADIILTTVHSAKGLEWDHVIICDDLYPNLTVAESLPAIIRHPSFLASCDNVKSEKNASLKMSTGENRKGWQFDLHPWQDQDINMLYVALTRARRTLSVPSCVTNILELFDRLHYLVGTFISDASSCVNEGRKMPLISDGPVRMMMVGTVGLTLKNKGDVWNLYHDLVVPLRKEWNIANDMMILPSLFVDCDAEQLKNKFEQEEQQQQQRQEVVNEHAKGDATNNSNAPVKQEATSRVTNSIATVKNDATRATVKVDVLSYFDC